MSVDCEQSVLLKPLYFGVALEVKQQFVHPSIVILALSTQPKTKNQENNQSAERFKLYE